MINRADYDIDLTIPPEMLEQIRENEWRVLLTCIHEGHQWINRSHGQKQCRACGYYQQELDDNGMPLRGKYAYSPDEPTLNMSINQLHDEIDRFDAAAILAEVAM